MDKYNWKLLAKYFSNNITGPEAQELQNWKNTSEENRKEFLTTEKLWNSHKKINLEWDTKGEWNRFLQLLEFEAPESHRSFIKHRWEIAAAVVSILLISIMLVYHYFNNNIVTLETEESITNFYLPDSSQVWLNGYSQITYSDNNYNRFNRIIHLTKGEAFFQVKRDTTLTFLVKADGLDISALGTSFNIKISNDRAVFVTVASGNVELGCINCRKNNSVYVKPMSTARYDGLNHKITILDDHEPNRLFWLGKDFVFNKKSTPPKDFLAVKYDWKTNVLGMPVVHGTIRNKASTMIVGDVRLKASISNRKGKKRDRLFYLKDTLWAGEGVEFKRTFLEQAFKYSTSKVEIEVDSVMVISNYP